MMALVPAEAFLEKLGVTASTRSGAPIRHT
jgi:hypothetical protein